MAARPRSGSWTLSNLTGPRGPIGDPTMHIDHLENIATALANDDHVEDVNKLTEVNSSSDFGTGTQGLPFCSGNKRH